MPTHHVLVAGAYVLGLAATLVLAAWLTPARWWKRPNLRAITIVAGGTIGIGALLASLLQAPALAAPALNHGVQPLQVAAPLAAGRYRAHRDLNLRAGTGVNAARLGVVPAGTLVTASGARDGDWWQVSAQVGQRRLDGWASSLWLRRSEEGSR